MVFVYANGTLTCQTEAWNVIFAREHLKPIIKRFEKKSYCVANESGAWPNRGSYFHEETCFFASPIRRRSFKNDELGSISKVPPINFPDSRCSFLYGNTNFLILDVHIVAQ